MAGVDDTISWWNENGMPMVLIQPDMNNAPVQVIRAGNDLYIKAYVSFYGDANDIFPGTKQSYITTLENVKNLPRGKTYAEIIQEGIESNWKGEYEVYGQKLKVTTIIYSNSYNVNDALRSYLTYKGDKQKTLGIYVHNEGSDITTSFVTSWVIDTELLILSPSGAAVKYLQTEEERTNWSIKNPGTVHLYNRYKEETYSLDKYRQMAAHEFGHVLGIGDAYNTWYRGGTFPNQDGYYAPEDSIVYYNDERYEVWTPDDDMMITNQKVSANDIRMVWDPWRMGKPQFFPWGSKVREP